MAKRKYYQRPDGLFEAIRTINGKRVAFRGKTCREVDRKILEYQEEKEKGRTVEEITDAWLESTKGRVSASTEEQYGHVAKIIKNYFGKMRATEVKPIHCQRFLEQMAAQGYKLGTVSLRKAVMIQVFRYAVIAGDIDASPATEVRLPRGLDSKKREALTEEQIQAVTNCREGDWWLLGVAFLWTGCRLGELLALTYEDIDRKARTITINKKYNFLDSGSVLEEHTKTSAGMRTIPLLAPLADVLPKDRIGLIFHNADGSHLEKYQLRYLWKEYQKTVGLPAHITPHYFRHTFATICYDAGIDPKEAASFLGHADEKITTELYTHLSGSRRSSAAGKMEEYARKCAASSV